MVCSQACGERLNHKLISGMIPLPMSNEEALKERFRNNQRYLIHLLKTKGVTPKFRKLYVERNF